MARTLLPPRGLFIGTRWLFDPALPASVKETLIQLMTLSWGRDGHATPPISYPPLEALPGKHARTLRGHLLALRNYHAALRLQRADTGQFIVALADWLFINTAGMPEDRSDCGEILPEPDLINQEDEELTHPGELILPLLNDHAARSRKTINAARGP